MDTDVEVIKPLDKFMEHSAFSGFESQTHIPTGIMGAERNHVWIKDLLGYYKNRSFIFSNGKLDLTPNPVPITNVSLQKYGLKLNNSYQILNNSTNSGKVAIYPIDVFCPLDCKTRAISLTDDTYTIHHFAGSWGPPLTLKGRFVKMIGPKWAKKLLRLKHKFLGSH